MKVRFNNPRKSYTNKFSFDNNTTFGIGNVQPLFFKQLCSGSKISVNFNQLTRLSPLVVPTFARLKQRNDFAFVPMSMVMPSFDAFLSSSLIKGTKKSYMPNSLPCTTNADLFISLCSKVAFATLAFYKGGKYQDGEVVPFLSTYGDYVNINNMITKPLPTTDELHPSYFDFILDNTSSVSPNWSDGARVCIKLSLLGRFWYSVLRGLGYTLDPNDTTPVSILPLWSFVKAYYDIYYPKRDNSWHASNYYSAINSFYNGNFVTRQVGSLYYDMIPTYDSIIPLFGTEPNFDFFAPVDDSLASVATPYPINYNSKASNNNTFDNSNLTSKPFELDHNDSNVSLVPALTNQPSVDKTSCNSSIFLLSIYFFTISKYNV